MRAARRAPPRPTATCSTAPSPSARRCAAPHGCPACLGLGYRGRTGIYEVVTVDREMEALIHRGAAEAELVAHARRLGPSLIEDGVRKIGEGRHHGRGSRPRRAGALTPVGAFTYRAVDRGGKPRSGVLEAASAAAARQDLRARGLLPVEVAASGRRGRARARRRVPRLRPLCCRHRRARPHADHPPARDPDRQRRPDRGRAAHRRRSRARPGSPSLLLNVRAAVLEGRSFGQALADYPAVFSEYYRASVTAGEQSGQLDQVMRHLADLRREPLAQRPVDAARAALSGAPRARCRSASSSC